MKVANLFQSFIRIQRQVMSFSRPLMYLAFEQIRGVLFFVISTNNILIWEKVFKSGPSKVCGRQPLKNLKGYGLLPSNFLKAVFHKFYLVHS